MIIMHILKLLLVEVCGKGVSKQVFILEYIC